METWTIFEVLWTGIAIVGALFSYRNIQEGLTDFQIVSHTRPKSNGVKILEWEQARYIALGTVHRDSIRLVIQVVFAIMGITAGFLPSSNQMSVVGLVMIISLIACSLLLTVSTIMDYIMRKRLLDIKNGN